MEAGCLLGGNLSGFLLMPCISIIADLDLIIEIIHLYAVKGPLISRNVPRAIPAHRRFYTQVLCSAVSV